MENAVAQVIGFIGMLVFVLSFQCKSARRLLWVTVLSSAIYIVHFYLLHAYAGALLEIFLVLNYTICNFGGEKPDTVFNWRGWKWVFSACYVVSTVLSWQSMADLLPCAGSVATSFVGWTRNGKKIRVARLAFISPVWLAYDIIIHSYGGILAHIIGITSILISVWRYGWKALDQVN